MSEDQEWKQLVLNLLMMQCELMRDITSELRSIREVTEQANEAGPDDEPSPLQSLNW